MVGRTTRLTPTPGDSAISVKWLSFLLIVASLIELAILRIGTRTVIHIPDIEAVSGPYHVAASLGRLAFFSALVFLLLLLAKLVIGLCEGREFHAAAALTVFLLTSAGVGSGLISSASAAPVLAVIVAVLGAMSVLRTRGPLAFGIGLFVIGYLLSALQSVARPGLTGGLIDRIGAADTVRVAEILVVGAALASWPIWRRTTGEGWRPARWPGLVSVAAGVLVILLLVGNSSTTTVLMLWNFGLTGTLPAVFYGLATTSALLAISSIARSTDLRVASALVLLVLGGVGLTSTYQSGLTVAGLAMLLSQPTSHLSSVPASEVSEPNQSSRVTTTAR